MAIYSYNSQPRNPILSLVFTALALFALYYIAKGIFWVLLWVSPVFLILTLVIDYKVVLNYLKWLGDKVQRTPISGILMGALTIFGFPVVAAFLFFKAYGQYRLKKYTSQFQDQMGGFNPQGQSKPNDEFVEYEEIKEEPISLPRQKVEQRP